MTVLTRNPVNPNPLQPNKFQLNFSRLPNMQFFCQNVDVPGISLAEIAVPNPFVELYSPGEKTIYDEIRKILLDITHVYRDYIRNYYYSNPIKKVLWYLSDNKTAYDKIKLNMFSLITNIERQIGKNDKDKYKSAQTAMDIVLGRGGDQAVIRQNDIYKFFGGRAQEVEKRTKVAKRKGGGTKPRRKPLYAPYEIPATQAERRRH